ncbi:MAG: DUF1146 domain-containing protein [Solobacterium sp.]|nr:DUF1146 domain-containing protein [Solobacterium sp.]
MSSIQFLIRSFVYIGCFLLSLYALDALDYSRFLKKDRVRQAQILYVLLAMGISWLCGSFLLVFVRNI